MIQSTAFLRPIFLLKVKGNYFFCFNGTFKLRQKSKLLHWLCIDGEFFRNRSFGGFISFTIILLMPIVFGAILWQFGLALFDANKFADVFEQQSAIRNMGLVLAAFLGVPFVIWRSIIAQKGVDVAEQGLITDRIAKAVEGLGTEKTIRELFETPRYVKDKAGKWQKNEAGELIRATRPDGKPIIDRKTIEKTAPNLEVRIGAIYALERIAQDSLRDHIQIMEILCAYIRENSPVKSLELTEPPFEMAVPRTDIQVAITVIGRRAKEQIDIEWEKEFRLDLRNSDLSGVSFKKLDFSAAIFNYCRLEAASFRECNLTGAWLVGALLNFAVFFDAELRGTNLNYTVINRPKIVSGSMLRSITFGKIYGITVAKADLSAIDYLGEPEAMNLVFGTADTILSHQLEFDRNRNLHVHTKIKNLEKKRQIEEAVTLQKQQYKNGFGDWSPFSEQDLSYGMYYARFLDKLGLYGWPYR